MRFALIVAIALALPAPVPAQTTLYRCDVGGKVVYQQRKCDDGKQSTVDRANAPLSDGEKWDINQARRDREFKRLIDSLKPAEADTSPINAAAQALCDRTLRTVNQLVEGVRTYCTLGKDRERKTALIFISQEAVFGAEPSKRMYLLALIGALGDALNTYTKVEISGAVIADKDLSQKRVLFFLAAADAARLQRDAKNNRITTDEFYDGILRAGTMRPLKP